MIASGLIVSLITAGAIGFRQITVLNQFAATRTSHTEMRAKVIEVLSDTGNCAKNLCSLPSAGTPVCSVQSDFTNPQPIGIKQISQVLAANQVAVRFSEFILDRIQSGLRSTSGYGSLSNSTRNSRGTRIAQ